MKLLSDYTTILRIDKLILDILRVSSYNTRMLYTNKTNEDQAVLVCDCGSTEHSVTLTKDDGGMFLTLSIEIEHVPFLTRLWRGLSYAFTGTSFLHTSLDEIVLTPSTAKELVDYIVAGPNPSVTQ